MNAIFELRTISETGRQTLQEFISAHHKSPETQNLSAWVDFANDRLAERGGDCVTIEMTMRESRTGQVYQIELSGDDLSVTTIDHE